MSSDNDCELLNRLNDHLENHRTIEAVAALKNENFSETVKDKSWELISAISKHINEDASKTYPDLVQCCRELLMIVAQYANAEEALLKFIEIAECPDDDILFISLLDPLITSHMRLPRRRGDSLKWLLSTVLSHLNGLSTPNVQSYEGPDERKLMDLDPAVVRINTLYSSIIDCLQPLIKEVSSRVMNDMGSLNEITSTLIAFILRLMGGPLSFLDLSYDGQVKSEARVSIEKLVKFFASLSSDMMSFLEQVEILHIKSTKDAESTENNEESCSERDTFSIDQISEKCFAVLYYMILGEKIELDRIPCVYNHFYVFQCCMYLSTTLLNPNEDTHMLKGLSLAKAVIEMQMDSSLTYEALDSPVHSTFQKSVINAMVYCSSRECRTIGVNILELYIKKFDEKGMYIVLSTMLYSADHSGIAGFLLVQLKEILNNVVFSAKNEQVKEHGNYFVQQSLLALLLSRGGCTLSHGAETDLLESSDQILSALNLLRFLVLRDSQNITGFWDHVSVIRDKFLNPLREGIDLSRAHYRVKRKDLEKEKKSGKKKESDMSDVTVTIAGQNLPHLPVDKKILVVESALNTFDLIESLMGRLNECLESGLVKN